MTYTHGSQYGFKIISPSENSPNALWVAIAGVFWRNGQKSVHLTLVDELIQYKPILN